VARRICGKFHPVASVRRQEVCAAEILRLGIVRRCEQFSAKESGFHLWNILWMPLGT
jgi:hypothetical protein